MQTHQTTGAATSAAAGTKSTAGVVSAALERPDGEKTAMPPDRRGWKRRRGVTRVRPSVLKAVVIDDGKKN